MAKDRSSGGRSASRSRKARSSRNGRRSTAREQRRVDYPDYESVDPDEIDDTPDVLLDIPVVKVDEIGVDVDNLRATVSVRADLQHLVNLNVGVAARLGNVELKIRGVEAQGLLKARLDNVSRILARVLTTLDRNPALLESIGRSIEHVGTGAQGTLEGAGGALGSVGRGGREAVRDVGSGAGEAVGEIGEGAGKLTGDVGKGAGDLARGAGGDQQGGS